MDENISAKIREASVAGWLSVAIALLSLILSAAAVHSVGLKNLDSVSISMAVLQTFLAFGAFATFFIFRGVVEKTAQVVAEEKMQQYLSNDGNGTALIREIVESWRPESGVPGRNEDETDNIMEALSD